MFNCILSFTWAVRAGCHRTGDIIIWRERAVGLTPLVKGGIDEGEKV